MSGTSDLIISISVIQYATDLSGTTFKETKKPGSHLA
jgi:hypothetical protein